MTNCKYKRRRRSDDEYWTRSWGYRSPAEVFIVFIPFNVNDHCFCICQHHLLKLYVGLAIIIVININSIMIWRQCSRSEECEVWPPPPPHHPPHLHPLLHLLHSLRLLKSHHDHHNNCDLQEGEPAQLSQPGAQPPFYDPETLVSSFFFLLLFKPKQSKWKTCTIIVHETQRLPDSQDSQSRTLSKHLRPS